MTRNSPIDDETLDAIAACGFDVYAPAKFSRTYAYFTDGTRIGYIQRGDFRGYRLSTVHVPNKHSGTGFAASDDHSGPITRKWLENAFVNVPSWASGSQREATRKWADWAAFAKSYWCALECVRERAEA